MAHAAEGVVPAPESKHLWRYVLILSMLIASTRVFGLLAARDGVIFNLDEIEQAWVALDRFLGLPSTVMHSPGAPFLALSLPVVVADFLAQSRLQVSQHAVLAYLAAAYSQPWHIITLLRWLSLLVTSVGIATLFVPVWRQTGSVAAALFAVTALALTPVIWVHSHIAKPDGLAVALVCFALVPLTSPERSWRHFAVAGALMGTALADKIALVPLLPFVVGMGMDHSRRLAGKVAAFVVSAALAFAVMCPFTWYDPIRLVKSLLAGFVKSGEPLGFWGSGLQFVSVVLVALLILAVLGAAALVRGRRLYQLLGGLLAVAAVIWINGRAPVIYSRYYVGAVIPVVVLAGHGIHYLQVRMQTAKSLPVRTWSPALVGVVWLVVAIMFIETYITRSLLPSSYAFTGAATRAALLADLRSLPCNGDIVVPLDLFREIGGEASPQALLRLAGAARMASATTDVGEFGERVGLAGAFASSLTTAMNEDEQSFPVRLEMMARSAHAHGLNLGIWSTPVTARRLGLVDEHSLVSSLADGAICAALVYADNLESDLSAQGKPFGRYVLLVSNP